MRKRHLLTFAAVSTLCISGLYSCSKDDSTSNNNNNNNTTNGGNATVSMHLTDAPGDYDALWLNIQQVEVTMDGHEPQTIGLIRPGMYDLLSFRNGLDTLLVRASLPAGRINQIRLILGDGNKVVVDGQEHDLTTPSAQQSGLKLNLNDTFAANGAYDVWIDFDAAKSVHQTGNGKYMLKPVIRAYSAATNGRIKGYVLPAAALTTVYAINGVDTFAAIPAPDGYFIISGLPAANYQVVMDAADATYQDATLSNVEVKFGLITDIGTTTLTQ